MAKVKKAQDGTPIIDRLAAKTAERNTKGPEFRPGQVKRMTRVFNANPERGVRVAKRMLKRANDKVSAAAPEMKKGGKMSKVKAKDGKWIQKAINPKHKGYCTPMTKATCTPKRKALAVTLKKMAKARKGK